jgi:spermidine/putrescine transport system substrate-binding protein
MPGESRRLLLPARREGGRLSAMETYSRRGVIAAGAALAAAAVGGPVGRAFAAPGPKPSGTLHFYDWIDYVHPHTYTAFTRATGIAVKRSYYTSNEALYTRLKSGGHGFDLAVPTGYMVATLAEERLLERIDWKKLPTVRRNIDAKFLGLPYDARNEWSVPKDWGTTGFVYRTDLVKERPKTWSEFFSLFRKHPRRFTLLDDATEVVGSIAVMLGYSYNTDDDGELEQAKRFLLVLKPYVHSIDSQTYDAKIIGGSAFGGMAWNGDGLAVIAKVPNNTADYVVAKEGGELWVDAYVIPRGAPNRNAAHAWIDFVYGPRNNAYETTYTYFGSPLQRRLLAGILTPTILSNRDVFPAPATMRHLEPNAVSAEGARARNRIWTEFTRKPTHI